jgi:hypothetical protein
MGNFAGHLPDRIIGEGSTQLLQIRDERVQLSKLFDAGSRQVDRMDKVRNSRFNAI